MPHREIIPGAVLNFHKVLGILIKDPPRAGSFRSNTIDSLGTTRVLCASWVPTCIKEGWLDVYYSTGSARCYLMEAHADPHTFTRLRGPSGVGHEHVNAGGLARCISPIFTMPISQPHLKGWLQHGGQFLSAAACRRWCHTTRPCMHT
jgi:hypothetical protein